MSHKRTEEQISYNMSRIKNKRTTIELLLEESLRKKGITTFLKNQNSMLGSPDFVFPSKRVAVFCDGDFWHGYNWEEVKDSFQTHREYWVPKIEKNIMHDEKVSAALKEQGWSVIRFWGHDIKTRPDMCADAVIYELQKKMRVRPRYRTIDLCAGIGGIRRGFEMTGAFENVLSAEVDKYACKTYQHLFGDNPYNDLTEESFKERVEKTPYEVLLAGFPCQTFSRVGKEKGFEDETKGQIFFHIANIIERTRPVAFFLENVDRIVTHDNGNTFNIIIDTLVNKLGYRVVGVESLESGELSYNPKNFIRNSRDFGVPQNRPRAYIMGFDSESFDINALSKLPKSLPTESGAKLYTDLNDLLDKNVDEKYYMAEGYLNTLVKHRIRQEKKGYGFGYRVVNEPSVEHPVANTLLATGGSGRERNLILDPREGIAGKMVPGKHTPLNGRGIRVMTPKEWGKLQGFVNYAFLDENGNDTFSLPPGMTDVQLYKQFGNSVTIPTIKRMAQFMLECFASLTHR